MKHQKFSKMNTLCECRGCGKKTHSSIDGNLDIQLCRKCYDEALMENEHSDGHHVENKKKECQWCQSGGMPWEHA